MGKKKILFGATFLAIGLIIGITLSINFDFFEAAESASETAVTQSSLEGFSLEDAVINVANTTGKAVVSISTESTTKVKALRFNRPLERSPFGQNDPFRSFFDDFFGQMPDREFKQRGLGTGVIIDSEGYILTNEHVINDADKITVTLPDAREFTGEVKGRDPRSDLAVIKINAHKLPVASLGNSDGVKIGQWVVAIGNPFGYVLDNPEPTVTVGVISALHRSLGRTIARNRDYSDLIQTDAAINPGNSGGPLVNLKGEVVGINVAIFSTSGGYQGIGFAIPVNSAKRIISRLIEGKKILYGWLGVTVQDLNDDLAKYFNLSDKNGVLIAKVLKDGPSDEAGIKESDIIKKFDGKVINNVKELLSIVASTEVGKKVRVELMRENKALTLTVKIGERPEDVDETMESASPESATASWRGLEVEGLSKENAMRYRIQQTEGVIIVNVEPNSQAEEAGLVPGDVISEVNKQNIANIKDYEKSINAAKGNVLVKTQRGYFIVKE